ncbi:MAG: AhpC/TSA family protein [Prevotella sp.]|nr:AhpC/TSA family protein [Prevotella sp.]
MKGGLWLFTLLLLLASCGTEGGKFRLEGRLRNLNQGEFWVYSPDGGISGIDTIQVRDSRFVYELTLREPTTLVVIFPNYSEIPVFAESGGKVTMKGDATHLKEIELKGTGDNDLMTQIRLNLNQLTPPEIPQAVSAFIREHPASPTSIYLLQRYFVMSRQPDYKTALSLTLLMLKENPDNGQLIQLKKQLSRLQGGRVNSRLTPFTATDVKGRKVTEKDLRAKVNVVSVWASWSYQSQDMQRRLMMLKNQHGSDLSVLSICLDANVSDCRQRVVRDSLKWPTVCDGRMWQTPLLSTLGIADVPDNLLIDGKGTVVARSLTAMQLEEAITKRLK